MKGQVPFGFSAGVRAQEVVAELATAMADLVAAMTNKAAAIMLDIPEPTLSKKLRKQDRNQLAFEEAVKLIVVAPRERAKEALAPLVRAIGCKPLEDAPPSHEMFVERLLSSLSGDLSPERLDHHIRKARGQ